MCYSTNVDWSTHGDVEQGDMDRNIIDFRFAYATCKQRFLPSKGSMSTLNFFSTKIFQFFRITYHSAGVNLKHWPTSATPLISAVLPLIGTVAVGKARDHVHLHTEIVTNEAREESVRSK